MKYFGETLARKLRFVLNVAAEMSDAPITDLQLARIVEAAVGDEGVFTYTATNGEIKTTSADTIRKYVMFLRNIGYLNSEYGVMIDAGSLADDQSFMNYTSENAREILYDRGVGVHQISSSSTSILRDTEATLPTIERVYNDLADGTDLSLQHFRWLIYLYNLQESPLIRAWQRPLILTRDYL